MHAPRGRAIRLRALWRPGIERQAGLSPILVGGAGLNGPLRSRRSVDRGVCVRGYAPRAFSLSVSGRVR